MSYTAPPTFVASDVLEADQLNVLSDDIADLNSRVEGVVMSAVHARRSSNQSTATATPEYVSFNAEIIDVGGWFPGSGTTITVPASAVPAGATTIGVVITATVTFATNATGFRAIEAHVNGSDVGGQTGYGLASDPTVVPLTGVLAEVAAGDTIQLQVEQTSGGALNVTKAEFNVVRIGVAS